MTRTRGGWATAAVAAFALLSTGAGDSGPSPDILESGEVLYSQGPEELIIRHFFDDRRGGFFLDVGAWQWKEASTTFYLEKHLGWTGIAIDALREFKADYLEHRPKTQFFNYAVSARSGGTIMIYTAGPLTSTFKDHLTLFPEAKGRRGSPRRVPTITLNDLLDREGIDRIDFLSMDIEESEPAALAGFDIERFRPELVCIEATERVKEPIAAYFKAHGYERIDAYLERDPSNWYYRPIR